MLAFPCQETGSLIQVQVQVASTILDDGLCVTIAVVLLMQRDKSSWTLVLVFRVRIVP